MEYKILKIITILLTTIMLPFGTYVGYQFGVGNIQLALIFLSIQTITTFLQAYFYWLMLEIINEK